MCSILTAFARGRKEPGWQIKEAAGGEGGHGVVIYRYISNQATIAEVKGVQIRLPRDGQVKSGIALPKDVSKILAGGDFRSRVNQVVA
jgi:hypothetical protein